jgi:hypothetical protein
MGYRSEMAIVMTNKHYDEFMDLARKIEYDKLKEQVLDILEDAEIVKSSDGYTVMYWDSIKWYDYDSDISWIEEHVIAPYSKVRVGEESGDIEVHTMDNNYDTGEVDYEINFIACPDSSIYIRGRMTQERAIALLNTLGYTVSFLGDGESADDKIVVRRKDQEKRFKHVGELIDFAKELEESL